MRVGAALIVALVAAATGVPAAFAGGPAAPDPGSREDRIEELQQELASLREDIEDLQEPVEEFELFEECMFTIGVTEYGRGPASPGFAFSRGGVTVRRPALALDIRGFGRPSYWFLSFPAEEPPSIECNEDAGEEESDD
jgi:hypothetical protein